jgi:tetratricopeptide (TPR) repeat protein
MRSIRTRLTFEGRPSCQWTKVKFGTLLLVSLLWDGLVSLTRTFHNGSISTTTNRRLPLLVQAYVSVPLKPRTRRDEAFPSSTTTPPPRIPCSLSAQPNPREAEIRRKIAQLRRQGKLRKQQQPSEWDLDDDLDGDGNTSTENETAPQTSPRDTYATKVRDRLGPTKSKLLGFVDDNESASDSESDELTVSSSSSSSSTSGRVQIGTLEPSQVDDERSSSEKYQRANMESTQSPNWIDPSLFDEDEDTQYEADQDEESLIDLVAEKMMEQQLREKSEKDRALMEETRARLQALELERRVETAEPPLSSTSVTQLTSGVGGSWDRNETAATQDVYQPKMGSWGAFPRPRDISKAYGGGRRIGPGFSNEQARVESTAATRERLQRYREKVGIEVESEKLHADEISEALRIGSLAMERGIYSTAVSALEKVTRYCSSNSKVGSKVFLELAMAYEAVGRTEEAIAVYTTLSKCRMEDIKHNAKRLLYGLEAMQFMQKNVKSSEFSRKRAKNVFVDTTGLANIAEAFDDKYNMAYLDLEKGNYYKKLTEAVVRSPREARQILLKAVGAGEVPRLRIVQALRSLARQFDDLLQAEIESSTIQEPVAIMDGKPILKRRVEEKDDVENMIAGMDDFLLGTPEQMMTNIDGEWRLQLLADKQGDGVKFFNNTVSWQQVDIAKMTFRASSSAGLVTIQQAGEVSFNEKRRVLRRTSVQVSGGGVFTGLFGGMNTGAPAAVSLPRQIITVDSTLLITRGVPSKLGRGKDDERDYFAVWRRVESGTFSRP